MSIGNNLISLATKSQRQERSPEVLVSRKLWGEGCLFWGNIFLQTFRSSGARAIWNKGFGS